jgi:hypothetical protein
MPIEVTFIPNSHKRVFQLFDHSLQLIDAIANPALHVLNLILYSILTMHEH